MFTDGPVTPTRLEVLIEFLRHTSIRAINRKMLSTLLQPSSVIGNDGSREGAEQTIRAADQLTLIKVGETVDLTFDKKDKRSTREIVLDALDQVVLCDTEHEPYFAPFYSLLLASNHEGVVSDAKSDKEKWVSIFTDKAKQGVEMSNRFNSDKITGLRRWYEYAGLGWFDPTGVFQPNPYFRIKRSLPRLFAKQTNLPGDTFITTLSKICPELDGGAIFSETTKQIRSNADRTCTLGLSHALVDLHVDKVIRLDCPVDARGWDIGLAVPPRDEAVKAYKINTVEYLGSKK